MKALSLRTLIDDSVPDLDANNRQFRLGKLGNTPPRGENTKANSPIYAALQHLPGPLSRALAVNPRNNTYSRTNSLPPPIDAPHIPLPTASQKGAMVAGTMGS